MAPPHPALVTAVVLESIFGYLSVPELKSARSVCVVWKKPASALLSKRTHMSLKKVLGDRTTKSKFSEISLDLFRRIKVEDMPSKEQDKNSNYKKNCITLMTINIGIVQEIHFEVSATLGWIMKPTFEKCEFPNLKKISVTSRKDSTFGSGYFPKDVAEMLSPNKKLCSMPKITCLELEHHRTTDGAESNYPYLITFQRLLSKCPNLERLKITGNMYLDLKSCSGRLKSLEWNGFPAQPSSVNGTGMELRKDFNTKLLLKMLGQVNETLEECILRATVNNYGFDTLKIRKEGSFNLPKFPKLKKLVLDPINGFGQQIGDLPLKKFPRLEDVTLNIQSSEKLVVRHLDELLSNMGGSGWTRIQELTIDLLAYKHSDRDALANLRLIGELFPNLKKFDVKLYGPSVLYDDEVNFRNWWKELANTFRNLEELILRLTSSVSLSKLMDAIGGAEFEELQSLRLVPSSRSLVSDDQPICNFEKVFLAIPTIIFEGFQFNGNTVLNMVRFSDHHKCNIYFFK